jgi:hypothetical protein
MRRGIRNQHLHRGTRINDDDSRHVHTSTLPAGADLPSDAHAPQWNH